MNVFCDSSVLIAALLHGEHRHTASEALLNGENFLFAHVHALNEIFSTLTGGALGFRVAADLAALLIRDRIVPRVTMISLEPKEVVEALASARAHGVRGGAVYDYMHLVAARKAGADILCTLNLTDFQQIHRQGDPEIRLP